MRRWTAREGRAGGEVNCGGDNAHDPSVDNWAAMRLAEPGGAAGRASCGRMSSR
jgi:hypothetical protein